MITGLRSRIRGTVVLSLGLAAALAAPFASASGPERPIAVAATPDSPVAETARAAHRTDRLLVRFRSGSHRTPLAGSRALAEVPGDPGLVLVEAPPGLSVAEAVREYRGRPDVAFAEPDFVFEAFDVVPNDPYFPQQWALTKIGAPAAWSTQTNASDVVVAVLDTGIDFNHPDLAPNLWTNPADGSHGFAARGGVVTAGGQDDNGHGTHVAGTIGAATGNGVGMAGVNWNVRLLALKFLDANGSGSSSDAILLLDRLVTLRQQGVNVRVVNSSWGGGAYSQSLRDAFARAEAAGILHVCASGNSNLNADLSPMYPAAFDLRGIVSVLASDSTDRGASFSNYGRATTDLSAPGASTLSTVPAGSCALCATAGYRTLSGTSMASPHVAGVAAALFHVNPSLTPAEARDVLLDPGSTDRLADAKAAQSTTSARLSFAKAIANPLLPAPRANTFPTASARAGTIVGAGQAVTLAATASDADGDPLVTTWAKPCYSGRAWLLGKMIDAIFPATAANGASFPAPATAMPATVRYAASTSDGRGGGAAAQTVVGVSASTSPGGAPAGTLSLSPSSGPAGTVVTVSFPAADPEGGTVFWDVVTNGFNGSSASCCFTGTSTTLTFPYAGVYRVRSRAVDRELNLSQGSSAVVAIGGATGVPPVASAVVDRSSGSIPLTVSFDLGSSWDPDGRIAKYGVDCDATGVVTQTTSPTGSCTFPEPGPHLIRLFVVDDAGHWDSAYVYAMATTGAVEPAPAPAPVPPSDTTPPSVSLTSPANGSTVARRSKASMTASASDDRGVTRVDFTVDGALICTAASSPWACTWSVGGKAGKVYQLRAIARDAAGNTATSQAVSVTAR